MSKVVKLRTYRIAVIICVLCGGLIGYMVGSDVSKRKLETRYERGYLDGERHLYHVWLEKGYIPADSTDIDDIWYLDTSWSMPDDSTDTMPAVDRDTAVDCFLDPIIIWDTGGAW